MRSRGFGVLAVVLAAMAWGQPAGSHPATWEDRDQTEDAQREMEIRSVEQTHRSDRSGTLISIDVQTFEDFDNSRLDDAEAEHFALMIAFNLDEKDDFDRLLYVDAEPDASGGYTLYGAMNGGSARYDPDDEGRWVPMRRMLGFVRVQRPATDVVRVSFPESTLKRGGLDGFRWQVRTVWHDRDGSEKCNCTNNSFDYAPFNRMRRGHT